MNNGIKYIEERVIHLLLDSVDHGKVLVFDLFHTCVFEAGPVRPLS